MTGAIETVGNDRAQSAFVDVARTTVRVD